MSVRNYESTFSWSESFKFIEVCEADAYKVQSRFAFAPIHQSQQIISKIRLIITNTVHPYVYDSFSICRIIKAFRW